MDASLRPNRNDLPSIALIVDDDPDSVRMVSTALEENGTTVLVARDGRAAIELLHRITPDVVLMDAMMPGLDGFETCRLMKGPPLMLPAPIIFMTGLSGSEDIQRGLSAGGVDYVTKPVNVDVLIARVTVHIVHARQIQAARAALDSGGQSIMACCEDGRLAWATPKALQHLTGGGALDGEGQVRSAPVRAWLRTLAGQPVSHVPGFEDEGTLFQFMGRSEDGRLILRISGGRAMDRSQQLAERFALTAREAEVLLWLTQGKTNRDIADILTLSARTVNKHLEQVFQKMGVDNRTAAAILADRALHMVRS